MSYSSLYTDCLGQAQLMRAQIPLMNVTAVAKYRLTPTNSHFHLHMTEICAEILGLVELQTQSETCG